MDKNLVELTNAQHKVIVSLRHMLSREQEIRSKEVIIWVEGHRIKEPSNLPVEYKAGHKACIDEQLENINNLPITVDK